MTHDVIIIGGGLAGLALAVALRRSQLEAVVVEQQAAAAPSGWDSRIYAISPANARFLAAIGVWDHLDHSRMMAVKRMAIYGDSFGALDFAARDAGVGELAWIMESSLLQEELRQSAKRQGNVELLHPASPTSLSISDDGVSLQLSDQRRLRASLVVAADGANSWTRAAAGIEVNFQPYEHSAVVANFRTSRAHRGVAFQWFRRDGVLAWLPLPGDMISIVWSTPKAHADDLLAAAPDDFCRRVAMAGDFSLGELTLETPPAAFPLRLMRAPRTVAPRLALIGDAAHTIHPLSGHGVNLGFQDACSLGRLLCERPDYIDCGDLQFLRRHERGRSEEVVMLQSLTHALQKLFDAHGPPLTTMRNFGLNLVNGVPALKNLLVRYAMG